MNLEQYKQALLDHDWYFKYADDYKTFQAGQRALDALRKSQRQLDPQAYLWNEQAPSDYQITTNERS